MISAADWIWMPHPAHFICARDCRFFLATRVGPYVVSTVGEMIPDAPVREIYAQSRGIDLVGRGDERLADYMRKIGYEEIGCGRKYETLVFRAKAADEKNSCCPWRIDVSSELDGRGYNEPHDAYQGHLELCRKWSEM